ncbi:unnamed protein product [Withania somnifera]
MREACVNYGFFHIANHGIPLNLLSKIMDMYKTFFTRSDGEKPSIPHNYLKSTQNSADTYEHLLFRFSSSAFDANIKRMASHFTNLGVVLEGIINECLGLPPDFLANYTNDGSWNVLMDLHYVPATEADKLRKPTHEDPGFFNIISIAPSKDRLVVNIGDVIQVLSNNKFKSATHRVVRTSEINHYSSAYSYNLQGDKWVEPLPQFTAEIGGSPKYRRFYFEEYHQLRIRNRSHPPANPEDFIHITHYLISR